MKNLFSIAIFFLMSSVAFGQSGKLKKANNYYDHLSYAYAQPLYSSLLGSEVDNAAMRGKLAFCYYQMGDFGNSVKYYREMINSADATADDYFYYAQALKQRGDYSESDRWMGMLERKNPNDSRVASYKQNLDYLDKIHNEGPRFDIKHLAINTPSADFGGYPSIGEQDYYFVSSRRKRAFVHDEWSWNNNRFLDLYCARRNGTELQNPDRIEKKVNSRYHEGPLCFSADGKTVYFTRNNLQKGKDRRDQKGIQNLKMLSASVGADGSWENIKEIGFNSRDYSVGHPTMSADGKTLYFASDMPGGFGGADIYKCSVDANGALGTPVNMGKEINSEGNEMFPWTDAEGRLFFSSNGWIGLGGLDVFVCLPSGNGLGAPINVGLPVNSNSDDFAFIMNKDGVTGYFSSNREGGSGDDDIYSFQLLKPFKKQLVLEGIAIEKGNNHIIPGARITLIDEEGHELIVTADENGKYTFPLEEGKKYGLKGEKKEFFTATDNLATTDLDPKAEIIEKNLLLEKDPGLALYGLVTDSKTKSPLEGVTLKITDNKTGEIFIQTVTPDSGDVLKGITGKKVGDALSYTIELAKEGYFPKKIQFNSVIKQPGIIRINEAIAGGLTMDPAVTDLRDLVQINDIRFDYNKFDIRPDAAKELDKVVEIMNRYPSLVIELGSHTDCRGTIAYNEKLSDKRAKASAAYIKARITNPDRIYGKGYGESKVLNGCECEGAVKSTCSEEEHQANRRTEFKVISFGEAGVQIKNNSTNSFGN